MKRWLCLWIWACIGVSDLRAEAPLQLQYLPKVPIMQTSTVQLEMNDAFPGYKLDGEAEQTLSALVTLSSDTMDLPISQAPFQVIFVLKDVQMELNANDLGINLKARNPHSSLSFAQSSTLIDKPIHLQFGPQGVFDKEAKDYQRILAELPALKDLHVEGLWYEWFQPIFALSGQDIVVGKTYEIETKGGNLPKVLYYTVKGVDEREIQAEIKGEMESHLIQLLGAEMNISGIIQGHVTWDRKNALMCQVESNYVYTGVLKINESAWTLGLTMVHRLNSKPAEGGI